ncbi:uncharacterized protein LOC101216565 [Cucumis sativus]|uniref:Uncharacterized protein n=1 Tax=Cucumis sativus TaxID=3659 RepID=A0A0A0KIC0_CUCSA|nr:uncharacterized protein LOC101216565 [Cucumis sativus]KGN48524.1 hypothetical protein Csa_004412 [Cucumis sativus]
MSDSADHRLPPPPLTRPFPLYKQHSWSPDADRDQAWLRRKTQSKMRRSKSVTDDDLEELKACLELGFGFNSPEVDPRLCETFPALGFYHAVNKQYNRTLSNSSASLCSSPVSESVSPSADSSPAAIISHGENPQMVKARLKQWAQVVACSVRQY